MCRYDYDFLSGLWKPFSARVYGDVVFFEVQSTDMLTYFDTAMHVTEDGGPRAVVIMATANDGEL